MRFDNYHPAINFIYFSGVIAFTLWFTHPVATAVSALAAFLYSVKLNGRKALGFNLCLVPLAVLYAGFYSYYNHFGVTPLRENAIGNSITLEALCYGLQLGITVIAVIMWLSCMFAIVSADKVVYLFGRISPKLSLFLSILLRSVPRVKDRAGRIDTAQRGIGRGARCGNIVRGVLNRLRIASVLVTWTMENFVESAASMKCRGYSLKGRTAFSIYRFDNRDRIMVLGLIACITAVLAASALDQMHINYNPEIIINPITPLSVMFYVIYAVLLLLPMALQIAGEWKFERLQNSEF